MKTPTRAAVTLAATWLLTGAAAAAASEQEKARQCKPFEAQVIDQRRMEGCSTSFCTAGTIDGNRGLTGTIESTFDSFAPGPSTTPEAARTVSFSLISTFTTPQGTLTTRETGISSTAALNPQRRQFAGFGEITGGTGRYAGATGWLQFAGRARDGFTITDTMIGEICTPR